MSDSPHYPQDPTHTLPHSDVLNVAALARLFRDTTTSYKYVFFLSLLEQLSARNFDPAKPIAISEILVEMLTIAWYPHTYFKLSFGVADQLVAGLESMPLAKYDTTDNLARAGSHHVRELITKCKDSLPGDLLRYVPYRVLRPFFAGETKGLKDHQVNEAIEHYALSQWNACKPLYHIDSSRQEITVHRDWADYLKVNFVFMRGAYWEWSDYMQRRNPNVPSVSRKLLPQDKRDALTQQTQYWKTALRAQEVRCIYSGQIVSPANFSLDHYLPWSFILRSIVESDTNHSVVNSAKSDNLPACGYFDKIHLQHAGLALSQSVVSDGEWQKQVEPFVADLKLGYEDLLDYEKLRKALAGTVKPLIELAAGQGFRAGWEYAGK